MISTIKKNENDPYITLIRLLVGSTRDVEEKPEIGSFVLQFRPRHNFYFRKQSRH